MKVILALLVLVAVVSAIPIDDDGNQLQQLQSYSIPCLLLGQDCVQIYGGSGMLCPPGQR